MAQFTNQAQLSYGNSVTSSNIAVGEIMEVLSASKTAVRASYSREDKLTFAVSVVNSGNLPFTGVALTDDLGAYSFGSETLVPFTYADGTVQYYLNGCLQPSPAVTAGPPMEISGLTIPAGGNILILYEVETNPYTPLEEGAAVTNTAVLAGTGAAPVTAKAVVTAQNAPELSITKSVSPVPVTENGMLTYTFLIQNTGNAPVDAAQTAVIRDVFDPLLADLKVSFNRLPWTADTDYQYEETTGVFTTVPGQVTVPAAVFTQDPVTGAWQTEPGISTLVISGMLSSITE